MLDFIEIFISIPQEKNGVSTKGHQLTQTSYLLGELSGLPVLMERFGQKTIGARKRLEFAMTTKNMGSPNSVCRYGALAVYMVGVIH
ncbi:hypothetical protein KSS87_014445 [Heliosperma pusillum]|nr:hypothetical protein KSS87_014445 [Heliosperma pusillum]